MRRGCIISEIQGRIRKLCRLCAQRDTQEVEVAAFVGLQHVLLEQPDSRGPCPRAAAAASQRRAALPAPASSTSSSIERFGTSRRMRSPVLHQARAARRPPLSGATCSTMVPNAVPLMRASEMRTMSFTPCARELLRDREVAGLRHAGRALRAGVAQHQHVVGRHVERRIVDARGQVLERIEHHRAALVLHQLRRRRPTA